VLGASSTDAFSVPVLVAAAAGSVAWWLVLGAAAAARRPPRITASATGALDLPPEPPAVAGLLANGFEVAGETAPAVVLDLAARGLVALEEVQPGKTICRLEGRPTQPLAPYEARVLAELETKAVDGIVPADALTTGPEALSRPWHRAFAHEVVADAQARGLTRTRWPRPLVVGLGIGLIAVVLTLLASAQVGTGAADDDATLLGAIAAAVAVLGVIAGGVTVGRMAGSLAQLPTPAGHEAATRVAGLASTLRDNAAFADLPPAGVTLWDRVLAYAAVFGAASLAVALLPMGAEDDHRAWSRVGGRWRTVRVRYPRAVPPAWGKHPVLAVALALFWGAVGAVVGYGLVQVRGVDRPAGVSQSAWRWVDLATAAVFVPVALVMAWCIWVLVRAVPDLWQRHTVRGDIVRARRFRQWFASGDEPQHWCYLAVDDGSSDRIAAWRLGEARWRERAQGETVRVEVTPRLGYVRSITPA